MALSKEKRLLKRNLKMLRNGAKENKYSFHDTLLTRVLRENLHLLEQEGEFVLKSLKHTSKLPNDDNEDTVVDICERAVLYNQNQLIDSLYLQLQNQDRMFDTSEINLVDSLLKMHLIHLAALGIQNENIEMLTNAIQGLHQLKDLNIEELFQHFSVTEAVFRQDPTGIYPRMTQETKAYYRDLCAKTAKAMRKPEEYFAQELLICATNQANEATHIGTVLYKQADRYNHNPFRGTTLLVCRWLIPLICAVSVSVHLNSTYLWIPLFFIIHFLFRPIIERFSVIGIPPCFLPRMDLEQTVPEEYHTLVTVSCLMPTEETIPDLIQHLEQLFLSNNNGAIDFCLLVDYKETKNYRNMPNASSLSPLKQRIEALNKQHGNRFFLLVRTPVYSETQKAFCGWERKRGAILQLAQGIKGNFNGFSTIVGDTNRLKSVRYLYALDQDTQLTFRAVYDTVTVAAHPLNQPVVDSRLKRVTKGYGILMPTIAVKPQGSHQTMFSKIFSPRSGVSVYHTLCSNHYQDLLGETAFSGKGLIHIDAFLTCLSHQIPQERTLSHDIVEGGFLRCGLVTDVEVADSEPETPFGWKQRQHRWIRGDFQNLSWILRANGINPLTQSFMLDNLVRALYPVATGLLIPFALIDPSLTGWCIGILLAAYLLPAAAGIITAILQYGYAGLQFRYFSGAIPTALLGLIRALYSLCCLISDASLALDASIKGIYRRFISHRNCLQWTPAADSRYTQKKGIALYCKENVLSVLTGSILLLFAPPSFRVFAFLFLACPILQWWWSKPMQNTKKPLRSAQRNYLTDEAKKLWQYYEDFCTKEDHYLPPDNMQEQPTYAIAHRTSPTNIGLMLLSCVCAHQLGFLDDEQFLCRLANTYGTVTKLERYRGLLLNWYSTKTCEALHPKYCSTVDSGNYACFLTTVKNYLGKLKHMKARVLAEQMEHELNGMDFAFLYHSHRNLFHIGYDLEHQQLSSSFYDMFMSEARMTSYYAIATGQIPPKHWQALNRTLTRCNGYVGALSWTGTSFEYMMPTLIMPLHENTLSHESVHFCIACQKLFAPPPLPWGCSESAYYAFDDQLNYQYKAHGINRLALKYYNTKEYVVSPYATFLALPYTVKSALKNLNHLKKYDMCGKYGFYEAIDFTPQRCQNSKQQPIRSYMAHHVGMSLCAITNVLQQNVLQTLFMQEKMAGAHSLLMEKIPDGASVYKRNTQKSIPHKPSRSIIKNKKWRQVHLTTPSFAVLSNAQQTLQISSIGAVKSTWRDLSVYGCPEDFLEQDQGVLLFWESEETLTPLTYAPFYVAGGQYQFRHAKNGVQFSVSTNKIAIETELSLQENAPVEQRSIKITNQTNQTVSGNLLIYFEPQLYTREQIEAHPSFCKLFIESRYDSKNNRLLFTKRVRKKEQPATMVVGLSDNKHPFTFCCSSRKAITRTGNRFEFLPFEEKDRACVPDACCCMRIPFQLEAKETKRETLIIAMGETECEANEAYETAPNALKTHNPFYNQTLSSKLAQTIMPYLLTERQRKNRNYKSFLYSRSDLWSAGISGDAPIIVYEMKKDDDLVRLKTYLEVWSYLLQQKIHSDFVVLYNEQGDYQQKKYNELVHVIQQCGLISKKDRNHGIHLVNTSRFPSQTRKAILATASYIVTRTLPADTQTPPIFRPIHLHSSHAASPPLKATATTYGGYFSNGHFVVTDAPNVPWTHILANENFGTQVTEKSLGFTFACNSRENRLTPWSNNPTNHYNGEWLIGKIGNRYYDLIEGTTAVFSPNRVVYYGTINNESYQVDVSVSGNQKKVTLTRDNNGEAWLVAYYTAPVMGFNRKFSNQLLTFIHQGVPMVHQPFQTAYTGYMGLYCNQAFHSCFQPLDFWQGHWQAPTHRPNGTVCCSAITQVIKEATFTLAFGTTPDCVVEAIHHPTEENIPCNTITIQTRHMALDEMVNAFLPHQVLNARLYAKTGFYQCSGAFGFRDQLQDASNMNQLIPEQTKRQILLHCSRQFEEGDVLHWWHELPNGPVGIRTRCSDDMLWLPLTIARYVDITNDSAILSQEVPSLKGTPLTDGQQERYDCSFEKGEICSVYEHGKRAIGRVTFSPRGLAHIGSCDWNDGFSEVGTEGNGESVWLTQFFSMVCESYADIAKRMNDFAYSAWLTHRADCCKKAVEIHCWDTNHYTRAYFDDGRVIGASACKENQIDVLPQAFAVLCKLPNQARNQLALQTAVQTNVDHQHRLIHLFTPSFEQTYAGYISAYPGGIRENGGQYTHGVIWLIQALLLNGDVETAYQLIQYVNPATHCTTQQQANAYQGEPYAIAGDITTHPDAIGRCGWTQYTGAAGWLYRIITEDLFGIRLRGEHLELSPRLPKALYESNCRVTVGDKPIEIHFQLTKPCSSDFIIPLKNSRPRYTVTDEGLID